MAHIVELREMSDDQLEERLEDLREEMFNLRFQIASARLEDTSRVRFVRREIAQVLEVLHKRDLAVAAAAKHPDIAAALSGRRWEGRARYNYEDSLYQVEFLESDGTTIATAMVNMNQKAKKGRRQRAAESGPSAVKRHEIIG
jgi:large subunit ribosomal protein L29